MAGDKPYQTSWPGPDERSIVAEMLKDRASSHWNECYEFVRRLVQTKAKNIPREEWDDIVQDAMMRINRSLSTFEYKCSLKTWLFGIVRSCIIDRYRKSQRTGQLGFSSLETDKENEYEEAVMLPVENECIARDELKNALAAIQEYLTSHAHQERNTEIVRIVLLEGQTLEEAARLLGCSAPVAGYVIRSIQHHLRNKMRSQE
jgi:RNA polymerase sigma factor (sigma-70 family)